MKSVATSLEQPLYDALVARAAHEERTQGVIMRRALRAYLETDMMKSADPARTLTPEEDFGE